MKYLLHVDDFGRSNSINNSIKKLIKNKKINMNYFLDYSLLKIENTLENINN